MSVLTAVDEADALEQLHRLGCTDGLPVVIPTPDRVERMVLAAVADPTTSLGVMGPLGAVTTIEKVAINAVMAGCEPDHMPIVVATLRALLRPEYDLSEAQSTTHSTTPLVVVSGPLATACGIAGGFGALGPGHRANASIGRAVRLCLMNIGGAKPGVSDMALLGHPGKFTMCLTENVAESPWEPCSVAAGFDPLDSVVTVDRRRGAALGRVRRRRRRPRLAPAAAAGRGPGDRQPRLEQRVLPHRVGRRRAQPRARRRARPGRAAVGPTCSASCTAWRRTAAASSASSTRRSPGRGDDDDELRALPSPDHVLVLVAGGGGLYSSVFPSWSAGAHANPILHERIETDQACAVPGLG